MKERLLLIHAGTVRFASLAEGLVAVFMWLFRCSLLVQINNLVFLSTDVKEQDKENIQDKDNMAQEENYQKDKET